MAIQIIDTIILQHSTSLAFIHQNFAQTTGRSNVVQLIFGSGLTFDDFWNALRLVLRTYYFREESRINPGINKNIT